LARENFSNMPAKISPGSAATGLTRKANPNSSPASAAKVEPECRGAGQEQESVSFAGVPEAESEVENSVEQGCDQSCHWLAEGPFGDQVKERDGGGLPDQVKGPEAGHAFAKDRLDEVIDQENAGEIPFKIIHVRELSEPAPDPGGVCAHAVVRSKGVPERGQKHQG